MADDETFPVVGTRFAILPIWIMELGPSQAMVYASLATFANADHKCWPKMESIALRAHVSTRTARAAIRALEEAGAIETLIRRRADGGNSSNGYVLHADPPAISAAPPGRTCRPGRQDVPPKN